MLMLPLLLLLLLLLLLNSRKEGENGQDKNDEEEIAVRSKNSVSLFLCAACSLQCPENLAVNHREEDSMSRLLLLLLLPLLLRPTEIQAKRLQCSEMSYLCN